MSASWRTDPDTSPADRMRPARAFLTTQAGWKSAATLAPVISRLCLTSPTTAPSGARRGFYLQI